MSASNRYMNWTGVAFTPTSGSAVNFTGVSSVSHDDGGSLAKFAGDADRYNSIIVNDFNEPSMTLETADVGAALAVPVGTFGTLVATQNDAKNGVTPGGGARTYTFLCVVSKNSAQGKHRAYGMASITFEGASVDGVTNPLSISPV